MVASQTILVALKIQLTNLRNTQYALAERQGRFWRRTGRFDPDLDRRGREIFQQIRETNDAIYRIDGVRYGFVG